MLIRTVIGTLLALVLVVLVAYLTQQDSALLNRPFTLTERLVVPVYAVVLASLLIGFLPVVTILVVQALRRDRAERRERRFEREAESTRSSLRRGLDYRADGQWRPAAAGDVPGGPATSESDREPRPPIPDLSLPVGALARAPG